MGRLVDLLRHKMQMLREDAQAVAGVVEDAFSGGSEVDDEALDAQLRQLFYDLQDARVLHIKRHEYRRDGQLLRGYTWSVLDEEAGLSPLAPAAADPMEDLYQNLGPTAWRRTMSAPVGAAAAGNS